ncbi:MAG TPA: hypothetical protein VEP90_19925, partial [Methylomirabilota bacterium]|nr:hypothetical protein [Methylomirabilota bacterium]
FDKNPLLSKVSENLLRSLQIAHDETAVENVFHPDRVFRTNIEKRLRGIALSYELTIPESD